MAEIKRPNYFTNQFLVEKDFDDEQAYHIDMRRRLNRVLHTPGVADGLNVTRLGSNQVFVTPGTAIDASGHEIALEDSRTYTLASAVPLNANKDVYLTIAFHEDTDDADHSPQSGIDDFVRITERPLIEDGPVAPVDGSRVLLARIRLNGSGVLDSDAQVNTAERTLASAKLAPGSVGTAQIANGAVDSDRIKAGAVGLTKLAPELQSLPAKLTGRILFGDFAGTAVLSVQIAARDLRGKVVYLQGWASGDSNKTPLQVSGAAAAWDVNGGIAGYHQAYAYCTTSAQPPNNIVDLFSSNDTHRSFKFSLEFTATSTNLLIDNASVSGGYVAHVTWSE